ncbi:MAG: D-aminoacyl-tRNA deacylase [Firmicutes bacterium]|nr:D-aminoacyl-tRNA deacylase [Bacillota bacterium]
MRAVVQRVSYGRVLVDGEITGRIGHGLMVLLGVGKEDNEADADYIADKIIKLRIFPDREGKMNLSLLDVNGEILIVSQFTLFGDCRKGRRPSYSESADLLRAEELYRYAIGIFEKSGLTVETGVFQAMMDVEICNKGPVTLLLDSKKQF